MGDMNAKPTFDMIEVEPGRRLHTVCEGPTDAPFVLYDAGAFGIYADGWWVREELKSEFRVCLYDRAGMGWSDPLPANLTPTPEFHVNDMRRLATALEANTPLILVGHSMAGLRLHTFANLYPNDLMGLVFVDAAAPDRVRSAELRPLLKTFTRLMQLGTASARVGLARAIAPIVPDELALPPDQKADKRRSISWVSHHKASRAELQALEFDAEYLKKTRANEKPMAVFSAGQIGRVNAKLAEQAAQKAGYGTAQNFPKESHVSLLNAKNAKMLADAVRNIAAKAETTAKVD